MKPKQEPTKVITKPNGPIIIDGDFVLDDGDGNLTTHQRLALCRCAASGKMPYCDGSHNRINFKS
jgi:CDGSH-type Zn-finger protein